MVVEEGEGGVRLEALEDVEDMLGVWVWVWCGVFGRGEGGRGERGVCYIMRSLLFEEK